MFKKLTVIILTIFSILILTSCGEATYNSYSLDGLKKVKTYTYNVEVVSTSLANSTEKTNSTAKFTITNGTYVISISQDTTAEYEDAYILSTTLDIVGNYDIDGTVTSITDHKESKLYYSMANNKVTAVKTEKTVTNETTYYNSKLYYFSYDYVIEYGDSKANVTFNTDKDAEGKNNNLLSLNSTMTFDKYKKDSIYIDNEMLIFFPRILKLTDNYSLSFKTIDVLSSSLKSMKYGISDTVANLTKVVDGYTKDGNPTEAINVVECDTTIDDRFSGTGIECYYLSSTDAFDSNILVEVYTLLNDSLGYLKYKLQTVA